jgi:oxygen-dependent protoporphyrinogen oxidase
MAAPQRFDVAVIGAGITGLSAAWELVAAGATSVTVLEAADRVGGKLMVTDVAGVPVDAGAESMLAVRPEALRLASEVGLKPSIVHPAVRGAYVLSGGHLRQLPTGLVSGVPTDLRALAASRIMSLRGLLRIPLDQLMAKPALTEDISVGEFLGRRLGREVVDRLAEPLLAGVYAGNPDQLSLRMANPSLFRQLARDDSLLKAANAVKSGSAIAAGARRGPVFAGIRGGVGRLADKTETALAAKGVLIRTGEKVTGLRRLSDGWQVRTTEGTKDYDAIVLAVPAGEAARLLRTSAPFAAARLLSIQYASVAVVTLAYPAARLPELAGTGFLVPPVEGYQVKGVTYVTSKWEWEARAAKTSAPKGIALVRASYGRCGDAAVLERDDAELASLARQELAAIVGLPPITVDERVTRWNSALPQYHVGHVELVGRARDSLVDAPGVALCGAAYDGVGVASCIASGRQAARKVLRDLQESAMEDHG